MGHFALSMLILSPPCARWLASLRTSRPRAGRPRSRASARSRRSCARSRALVGLGALTIFAGTAATAAGPARGRLAGPEDQPPELRRARHDGLRHPPPRRDRASSSASLRWRSGGWPAAARRPSAVQRPLTVLCVLLALQGVGGPRSVRDAPAHGARVGARRAGLRQPGWRSLWAACAAGALAPAQGRRRCPSAASRGPCEPVAPREVPRKLGLLRRRDARSLRVSSSSPAVSLLAAKTLEKGVA